MLSAMTYAMHFKHKHNSSDGSGSSKGMNLRFPERPVLAPGKFRPTVPTIIIVRFHSLDPGSTRKSAPYLLKGSWLFSAS